MGIVASYADVIADWEALLAAMAANAAALQELEANRAAFEDHVAKTKAAKARQDAQRAGRQDATQELNKLVLDGRELAAQLRVQVKAKIGRKSEKLVQFGIAPLRKAAPRKVKTPTEGAPAPTPAPKPAQ
ncbi:MAG TPA: hypothetical protein VF173_15460 [Thermoanaerobaculia bacterium]|nr:hypothetical protein [Thermoanaerobaculia bacterium]